MQREEDEKHRMAQGSAEEREAGSGGWLGGSREEDAERTAKWRVWAGGGKATEARDESRGAASACERIREGSGDSVSAGEAAELQCDSARGPREVNARGLHARAHSGRAGARNAGAIPRQHGA
jgi:hypothetical protein